jgi:hypothetical protein
MISVTPKAPPLPIVPELNPDARRFIRRSSDFDAPNRWTRGLQKRETAQVLDFLATEPERPQGKISVDSFGCGEAAGKAAGKLYRPTGGAARKFEPRERRA